MKNVLLTVLVVMELLFSTNATGQYTVIGPGTLYGDRKYKVAVAVHHTTEPCQFNVSISGPSYNNSQIITLENNNLENVIFDVPHLSEGQYNLTAEGLSGLIFKNTTKLFSRNPKSSAKIQTDKAQYKPGDVINFRVVLLDENLKPAEPSDKAVLWIEDPHQNRIREYKKPKFVMGVYTDKFQISDYPTFGGWKLAFLDNEEYPTSSYLSVKEYVLPKYEIKVEATEDISVKDGDLHIVVRANYTYGEPVNAKTTVVLEFSKSYSDLQNKERRDPPALIRTTNMVNGNAKFDLNLMEYAEYMESKDATKYFSITAIVEENFTGVKINGTTSSHLYAYRYKMQCYDYTKCGFFEADVEKEIPFRLSLVDSTPLSDTKSVVKLTFTETIRRQKNWYTMRDEKAEKPIPKIENKMFVYESVMNSTGVVMFKYKLPDLEEYEDFVHSYEMELEYLDEKRNIGNMHQYRKPKDFDERPTKDEKDYFHINNNYGEEKYRYDFGENAMFTLNCSIPMEYFIYNIIGRASIMKSERVVLDLPSKVYNLSITTTFQMCPNAELYVYFVDAEGEFHYAESYFGVDMKLQNYIEISAPEKVKPGEMIPIKIKTTPNSFVGLLAIDQSVLLQGLGNNDFTKESFNYLPSLHHTSTPYQGGYSRYPGEVSGVVTLTNAHYFYNWTKPDALMNVFKSSTIGNRVLHSSLQSDAIMPSNGFGAVAGIAGGSANSEVLVRKDFSETWLFDNIVNSDTEEFTYNKKIPDTITSWVLTGFSLNPTKGIGVTDKASKIITFQPFFVAVRLPYSVKRGEVINVPALVFNYLDKDLDVDVALENTDEEFEFIDITNEIINEQTRVQSVRVPANSARGVSFLITPKIVGNVMLKFVATSPLAGDAVLKSLKVVPEGVTVYANRAYLVNLKNPLEFHDTFELELPKDVVPDSEHIEFTVIGDLLGPVFKNLKNLLHIPGHCGEQTISRMLPNIMVMEYLKKNNKLTATTEQMIKRNIESAYQNILRYQHSDGSFSTFGPSKDLDKPITGSTWLTAYVVRALIKAMPYVTVKDSIISEALKFLSDHQASNGSFIDNGSLFYSSQMHHMSLTASVVLSFVQNATNSKAYKTQIDKALDYLKENLPKTEDIQAKALSLYTLHKADQEINKDLIFQFKSMAIIESGHMWWSQNEKVTLSRKLRWSYAFANEIEPTAYFLLVLLDQKDETIQTVLPIVKWLVSKRNSYGGFSSSQDTVVGLMALMQFAQKSQFEPAIMEIEFTPRVDNGKTEKIYVSDDNSLLLQVTELPQKSTAVDFSAKGSGAALVQVSYQYNIVEKDKQPDFSVETHINKDTPPAKLEMDVCVEYTGTKEASNMAIVEISLPSGYLADKESFENINKVNGVRHVESSNALTLLNVYFDSLHKNEKHCLPIEAIKSFGVALQKPVSIVVYDYYDPSKRTTNYYEVVSKMCDVCENDEECLKKCN